VTNTPPPLSPGDLHALRGVSLAWRPKLGALGMGSLVLMGWRTVRMLKKRKSVVRLKQRGPDVCVCVCVFIFLGGGGEGLQFH